MLQKNFKNNMNTKIEYVWLDGYAPEPNLRSKVRVSVNPITDLSDVPEWGFDGSSTNQAEGYSSDCYLKPVRLYSNFLSGTIYVLCEVMDNKGNVHQSNDRAKLKQVFYNVIVNALTHQKLTSDVKIEVVINKNEVLVTICNPNSFIEDAHLPHIFDTFYKVNSKGKGLGLAIVKTVLDAHGFTYAYENKLSGVCFNVQMGKLL
jgi:signal transduction histidine kinase